MEKWLNILVGILLFNNLYYLGFFFGADYKNVLIGCAGICAAFFIKSLILVKRSFSYLFFQSVTTQLVLFICLLSIIFLFVNPHNASDFDSNDIVRIIILFLYFSWTGLKYGGIKLFPKHLLIISSISLIIFFILAYFEYNFPGAFGVIFKEENSFDEKSWQKRIAGTIRDPNTYSCILIIYTFFVYYFRLRFKNKWLLLPLLLIVIYLINLSGSRQGLLLFIALGLYIFFSLKMKLKNRILVVVSIFVFGFYMVIQGLENKGNIDSVVSRVLTYDNKAEQSKEDRIQSIVDGVKFSFSNYYFLYGPGSMLFTKFWTKEHKDQEEVPPHNALFFLFAQFGIWAFFMYRSLILFFKKVLQKKILIAGVIFFLIISLLPSIFYYATGLILIWFVDIYQKDWLKYSDFEKKRKTIVSA